MSHRHPQRRGAIALALGHRWEHRSLATTALITLGFPVLSSNVARADATHDTAAAANHRCAQRLAISITGKSATKELLALEDPRKALGFMLKTEDFRERFARFINSEFNPSPGTTDLNDATYYVVKHVITEDMPWSEVFLGKFRLSPVASRVGVFGDGSGLGYFRSPDWSKRYEGNEEAGLKIATAYRIMNNVVGLKLTAVTASPNVDQSANGRKASPCNSCHFDGWFALDSVASILPQKGQRFDAYKGPKRPLLGGTMIGNDEELVKALVASPNFPVNACRLAFRFLYGRDDNRCESPILDQCIDAFQSAKTITAAIASIASEDGFCN